MSTVFLAVGETGNRSNACAAPATVGKCGIISRPLGSILGRRWFKTPEPGDRPRTISGSVAGMQRPAQFLLPQFLPIPSPPSSMSGCGDARRNKGPSCITISNASPLRLRCFQHCIPTLRKQPPRQRPAKLAPGAKHCFNASKRSKSNSAKCSKSYWPNKVNRAKTVSRLNPSPAIKWS